ncbi:hypothetical protein [Xylophilus sp. GOD-11R]|uniref:hypothetical protein n=1 Tax=Xylophilus sp. GOD-11R TaxID=3089814 RepID=UPI00298D07FA|nr:hypothetical protein [Xylophilus sp. GOD-11R]WPB56780.1 hypothetical protein R9X41_22010 [Xylophilus sp. GOD-11R]
MLSLPRHWVALCASLILTACSPEMNWRDVQPASTALTATMPCKPDDAMRSVPLDGRTVQMTLAGCEAGGATFVVGWAGMPQTRLGPALGEWQDLILARAGIASGPDGPAGRPFLPPGALNLPQSLRLRAMGRSPDGKPLALDAAWFATAGQPEAPAGQVFFAAIYGEPHDPQARDSFFTGMRLR